MPLFLWFCVIVAALSGFLFGYHTAVIAGAMLFIKQQFQLSAAAQGVVVSAILLGALIASSLSGMLADRYGRRSVFLVSGIFFVVGTWMAAEAVSPDYLVVGRFLTGLGVGLISVVAPMYLGEIAPIHHRGKLIALYQLAISVGILGAYGVNFLLAESGAWRWMLAWGALPALLQLLCFPFICESPHWLMDQGLTAKARTFCKKIGMTLDHQPPTSSHKDKNWKLLTAPTVRLSLLVGLGLSCLQQVTGINAVIYYAPQVFELIGFASAGSAIFATLGIGTINLLAAILAIVLLDRRGRKVLLAIGLTGMAFSLSAIALTFYLHSLSMELVAAFALMAYVAFFSLGLGPVTWVVIAEIYHLSIRGKAMSLAIMLNWICNYLVTLTFLPVVQSVGTGGAFVLFAIISVLGLIFVIRLLPETRGKTLKEIDGLFARASAPK